jgi:hypothetical protein
MSDHGQGGYPTAPSSPVMTYSPVNQFGSDSPLSVGNRFDVELSNEGLKMVGDLLVRSGDSLSDLFLKSLMLYKIAQDAKDDGNHLAIVNAEGEIDRDIIGL